MNTINLDDLGYTPDLVVTHYQPHPDWPLFAYVVQQPNKTVTYSDNDLFKLLFNLPDPLELLYSIGNETYVLESMVQWQSPTRPTAIKFNRIIVVERSVK